MKKIKYIGISMLFVLSFIYTNKVVNIIKRNDPIMKEIINKEKDYKILSVNAIIKDNTIIPGINGCTIDIDKSYENMKKLNSFNDKLLKYKDIIPEITLNNNFNKYIVSGNKNNRSVSIIVNITKSIDTINKYNLKLNVFLDSSLLTNGKININNNFKVYNGGINHNYDDITIEWMNDVINDSYNKSIYCINNNRNDDNLLICSRNKMYTINPNIVVNKSNIYNIKNSINVGDIIYIDEDNIEFIPNIVAYLNKKGISIEYLSDLLFTSKCK